MAISDLFVELLIKPFFSEKLRVIKYYDQKSTALRLLRNAKIARRKKGLALLFELTTSYPYQVQELVDEITSFIRRSFPQDAAIESDERRDLLRFALRSLAAMPRLDGNGFPHNFDLHQIRVESMDLTRANFRYFTLWGAQFKNVEMAHASFEEADLGGTIFDDCFLEYANFNAAQLNASFMDKGRPTLIRRTRLYGSNLHQATIAACEVHRREDDSYDYEALRAKGVNLR